MDVDGDVSIAQGVAIGLLDVCPFGAHRPLTPRRGMNLLAMGNAHGEGNAHGICDDSQNPPRRGNTMKISIGQHIPFIIFNFI